MALSTPVAGAAFVAYDAVDPAAVSSFPSEDDYFLTCISCDVCLGFPAPVLDLLHLAKVLGDLVFLHCYGSICLHSSLLIWCLSTPLYLETAMFCDFQLLRY